MIRCGQARRRILASRDGRLSLAERLELDEHLACCEACRALDAADARLEEALGALPEPPVEQLDLDAAVRSIASRIDAVGAREAARRVRRTLVWRRLAVACAAAVVLLVAWVQIGRRDRGVESGVPVVVRGPRQPLRAAPSTPDEPREELLETPSEPAVASLEPSPEAVEASKLPALELERLGRARATVRAAFAAAVAAVPGSDMEPSTLAARLAATVAPLDELEREGWPVTRLVERVVSDTDGEVAALATRWLGRRGDRMSIGTIASLLRRPDVPVELRRQAVLALLDDGVPGVEALAPALDDAALRPVALEGLVARGGPAAVRVVEEALGATRAEAERSAELAQALGRLGEPGLDALLRSVTSRGPGADAALAQMRRTRGARGRLVASLAERAPPRDADARLLTAARLGLAEALPHLTRNALERDRRANALQALAAFDGPGALAVVLELWDSGRVAEDDLTAVTRAQLARDPEAAVALCDEIELQGSPEARLARLLDLLLATESPAASPALARLVASPWLGRDGRQWAALALIGLGTEREARELADLLRTLGPADARLAAACALAIHAISGADVLRGALGPDAAPRAARLLALYESRPADRNQAVTLSRAARLLESWLDPENPERTRTSP